MGKYTVVCDTPDGGNVIEGRAPRYVRDHDDLTSAVEDACRWYRGGPNGPIRDAVLMRDGVVLDMHDEIERCGHEPLYASSMYYQVGPLVSCQLADASYGGNRRWNYA